MTTKMLTRLAATLGALSLSTAANAAVIYDNGGPTSLSGSETVHWVQAEDFGFADKTVVKGAGVYIAGFGDLSAWDGGFQYHIFGSTSGSPGALLASGSVSATPVDTGTAWCCGGNAYLYQFNFNSSFIAAGGATYWLGIHAGEATNYNRDDIYFVSASDNGSEYARQSENGTFDNWVSTGGAAGGPHSAHAFFLTGHASVPEPATWGLMIVGFGGIGGALRSRRRALLAT